MISKSIPWDLPTKKVNLDVVVEVILINGSKIKE